MNKGKMGLGSFLKEVEEQIDGLSKEEIKTILLMKAQNLKPTERESFLAELNPKKKAEVVVDDDTLLTDIDDFVKRIEDGAYSHGWGWDNEIHDEREWGDESWIEEMDELFYRTDELFLSGNLKLAYQAYGKLLKAFDMDEESGHFPGQLSATEMVETDLDEAKTRYLRALWDVASKGKPLGWSGPDSSQAVVIPFLMVSSVREIPLKSNSAIRKVWRGKEGYEDEQNKRFKDIVEKNILLKDISKEKRIKQIKWASSAVEKRVDAIVSNKYRGSYDKAALLLIGCVEALNLLDRTTEAQASLIR